MLPTAGPLPIGHNGWGYEIKWDGVRVFADVHDGRWRLQTRRGHDVTSRFPELGEVEALGDVLLDGELVVLGETGRPDFGATISRLLAKPARAGVLASSTPATVFAFDILRRDGVDLRRRPYAERREILEGLGLATERWTVPPVFEDGAAIVAASAELGLEGVVAKRLSSPYVSGRSRHWVKARNVATLDMTVVGWVRRKSGGISLLLAEQALTGLILRGRCTAPRNLAAALESLAADAPPTGIRRQPGVHWVRPELQVEVTAASREPDGRLRQPRFIRPRLDQLG